MSWAAVVVGGISAATGIAQYAKGAKIAKQNKRPNYQIPEEIKQNLSQAQMMALEGLPEEQKKEYTENVQRQQNFGLNALGDRNAGIAGLSALTQNSNDANRNLLSMDAQARQANQAGLMNARSQMASFQDKGFELNKLLPFQQTAAAAQGLQNAGMHNTMGGLQTIAGSIDNNKLANAYKEGKQTPQLTPNTITTDPNKFTWTGGLNQYNQPLTGEQDTMQKWNMAKQFNPNLSFEDFKRQSNITY